VRSSVRPGSPSASSRWVEENNWLRRQLAHALGDQRAAPRSTPAPIPGSMAHGRRDRPLGRQGRRRVAEDRVSGAFFDEERVAAGAQRLPRTASGEPISARPAGRRRELELAAVGELAARSWDDRLKQGHPALGQAAACQLGPDGLLHPGHPRSRGGGSPVRGSVTFFLELRDRVSCPRVRRRWRYVPVAIEACGRDFSRGVARGRPPPSARGWPGEGGRVASVQSQDAPPQSRGCYRPGRAAEDRRPLQRSGLRAAPSIVGPVPHRRTRR